jgi:hypothetical protein
MTYAVMLAARRGTTGYVEPQIYAYGSLKPPLETMCNYVV